MSALLPTTLTVSPGAIGLLGPNGAGKSTLIRLVLGLLTPSSGTVGLLGAHPAPPTLLDRVGYMPEHDCLPGTVSAVSLVSFFGRLSGLSAGSALERTHDILDYVGMGEDRYRKIAEYSTGMKQKVKMAQALVHDPDIVFFDEPTNGLDPEGRREMLDLLCDVSQAGKSIVLSTHLLPDVEHVCSDVVIMGGGRVLLYDRLEAALGTRHTVVRIRGDALSFADSLRGRGLAATVHRGDIFVEGEDVSAQVFDTAYRTGVQLRYLSPHTMSLEDLFLRVVGDGGG